jgi:hypothetical protein
MIQELYGHVDATTDMIEEPQSVSANPESAGIKATKLL